MMVMSKWTQAGLDYVESVLSLDTEESCATERAIRT